MVQLGERANWANIFYIWHHCSPVAVRIRVCLRFARDQAPRVSQLLAHTRPKHTTPGACWRWTRTWTAS